MSGPICVPEAWVVSTIDKTNYFYELRKEYPNKCRITNVK